MGKTTDNKKTTPKKQTVNMQMVWGRIPREVNDQLHFVSRQKNLLHREIVTVAILQYLRRNEALNVPEQVALGTTKLKTFAELDRL